MAKPPRVPPSSPTEAAQPPSDFPQVPPPRDLYATSDIRFVILEIGKLTAQVERLIEDVQAQGTKLDAIRHQVTFVKGACWVIGFIILAIGLAATSYFTGKMSITFQG